MAVDSLQCPATPAHLAWLTSSGRWRFPRWLQYLNEKVVEFLLAPGQGFLAIEAPVRSGKSLYTSVFTSAWFLGMWPDRNVILTTYSNSLSRDFGRAARNVIETYGPDLFGVGVRRDVRAAGDWKLAAHQGGLRAVSRGGTIVGTGGDLIVIDDPIKDVEEAHSQLERDRLWEWYQGTLRTRLEPGGKILLVASRWHADDLSGRLLNQPNVDGDTWQRVHLPALAEPRPEEGAVDLSSWRDELGRSYGEALWPERWPREALLQIRASVGPFAWSGQYQQLPVTPAGGTYPRHKWGRVDVAPRRLDVVCRIDLADSGEDYAAVVAVGRSAEGFTYVLDARRLRANAYEVENFIVSSAEEIRVAYGNVHFVIEQEPGSSGKTIADQYVAGHLSGYSVEAKVTSRNKELNAQGLSAQLHADNVFLVRAPLLGGGYGPASWWEDFTEEASGFPRGSHDDMVDAAAQAFNDLAERARKRRKAKASYSRPTGSLAV